jgi:excinuclease ABC subunit C
LNAAREVLLRYGFTQQPVIGLAKREEEIFLPDREESIKLDRRSHVLKLIQQVRNEAHRFAITFHRQLRTKHGLKMVLDEIPGIGLKRKEQILQKFGSLENLRQASRQQIQELLGSKTGEKLFSMLHPES